MTRPDEFLKEAIDTVRQRGIDNGYDAGQERSAAKIAAVFNELTGHTLTESDAWLFLIVLKLVRNQRKFKHDNIVDLAGYASLLGECQESAEAAPAQQQTGPVLSSWPNMRQTKGKELDRIGELLNIPRRAFDGKGDEVEESDADYRARLLKAFGGSTPDKRPHVTIYLASGHQLDAYGEMLKTPRKRIPQFAGTSVIATKVVPEEDKAYRERLIETARQADMCIHSLYEDRDDGCYCLNCKEQIEIVEIK